MMETSGTSSPTIDQEHEVFISYSRADGPFVRDLQDGLASRGRRAWVDWQDIPPTAEWMAEIEGAIEESDAVVYVLSPDSIASRTCSEEIEHALALNKRIVPIQCRTVEASETPDAISRLNWIVATNGTMDEAVDRLIEAFDTDLDRVRAHSRLLARTREWDASKETKTLLLRGSQLADAEALIGTVADPSPTPEQTRFVTASRRAATSRQRGLISIVTAIAVLAGALGVFAWTQRTAAVSQKNIAQHQTLVARSQALASLATSTLDTNLDVGALLTLEALRLAPTSRADQAVHIAVDRSIWMKRSLHGPGDPTRHLAFSPDGKLLVTLGQDGTLMRWSTATWRPVGSPLTDPEQAQKHVWCMTFSPDGSILATGGAKGAVVLWDVATWEPVRRFQGPTKSIVDIAFDPTGRTIATAASSGVDLWDAATGRHEATASTPADVQSPRSVAFSPDGRTIAIGGNQPASPNNAGKVEFWSSVRRKIVGSPILDTGGTVYSIAFSPDGKELVAGGGPGTALGTTTLWDTATHQMIGKQLSGQQQNVRSVAFGPDGRVVASASEDGTLFLWNTATGDQIGQPLVGHDSQVRDVAFSPVNDVLASVGFDGTVILWDVRGLGWIDHAAANFAMSNDGRLMASVKGDRIALDDPSTGGAISPPIPIESPTGQEVKLYAIAVSPDEKVVAIAAMHDFVVIWDVASRSVIRYLRPPGSTSALSFSADGRFLVAGEIAGDGSITTWDTSSWGSVGPPLHPQHGSVPYLTFGPVGDTFATSGYGITLWDSSSQRRIGLLKTTAYIQPMAFSPDGTVIAGGGVDGKVRLWETATRAPIGQPLVTNSPIATVSFSSDGRTLAAVGYDNTITVWDVKTEQMIGEPLATYGKYGGVAFTPDGQRMLLAFGAGPAMRWPASVWSDDPAVLRDRICSAVGRNLTHDEWKQYLPFEPYHRTCPGLPAA